MLKTIEIASLRPNPFRRLGEYSIIREKVDALKESIEQTGFWGTIVGRHNGTITEIAFGHHRLVALQESGVKSTQIIVRDLSNEDMLRMMARENMEEWGTSAWVELETIRSTIDAYGKGQIKLPAVPAKTREGLIRHVPQGSGEHAYTQLTVAQFLGWTRKNKDGFQPNYACETAFKALDAVEAGFLTEVQLKGLKRAQVRELIDGQTAIHQAEMRVAKQNEENAERARQRGAVVASEVEQKRQEMQAKVYQRQAEVHKKQAVQKARNFGEEGANMFRDGQGTSAVRDRVKELKPQIEPPVKIHQMDDFAHRVASQLEKIANGDDALSEDFKFLRKNRGDLSEQAANGLCRSLDALIARLKRIKTAIITTRSDIDRTEGSHVQPALNGECQSKQEA